MFKKIKVVHVITGLELGGAERVLLDMVTHSNKEQFDVSVISLSEIVDMLPDFQKNNIEIIALRKGKSLKSLWQMAVFLKAYIKDKQIDIVHAHMSHAAIVVSLVRLLAAKVKVVFTSHTPNIQSKLREWLLFLFRPLRHLDLVASKDLVQFYYKKNVAVVYNAIKLSRYNLPSNKGDKFVFISVGRLMYEKNHALIIKCAEKLKEKYSFEVWIVGEGGTRESLETLIHETNTSGVVKLLGLRKDVPGLLSKSHCFLLSSRWESMSLVVLEAATAGLPVVSTPVDGLSMLLNSSNSYVGDEEVFCQHMAYVIDHYQEAEEKAEVLRKNVEEMCSIEVVMANIERQYLKLINK